MMRETRHHDLEVSTVHNPDPDRQRKNGSELHAQGCRCLLELHPAAGHDGGLPGAWFCEELAWL